jgi:DNA polymerase V
VKSGKVSLVKKSKKSYRVARPNQTGFSSPATHYTEPRIDLNSELITNPSSTFYVRVSDDSFGAYNIFKDDVLIVDKSLTPKNNQLALITKEGAFQIEKISEKSKSEEFQLWGVITYIIKSTL